MTQPKKPYVSLKDIATELGLSVSTVSRALRDQYDIGPEVKRRVNEAAKRMGYRPNPMAQSLINQSTNLVGIIVPDFMTHFYSSIITGIEDVVRRNGYYALVASSHESYEREIESINKMLDIRACGIVMCLSQETDDYTHLEELARTGIPTVFVDRVPTTPGYYSVVADNEKATYDLTRSLIGRGYSRIAFVIGPRYLNITIGRLAGYRAALEDAGIGADEGLVIEDRLGVYDGAEALDRILALPGQPDAIICMNDTLMYGLMLEMRRRGLPVRRRLKVAGFIDELHTQLISPALSVVSHQTYEMGEMAAEKLFRLIRGARHIPRQDVCPSTLYQP